MDNKRLYVDLHVLQTVPPSCVNRDDTGRPKTAIYGGANRARVSSQAWKHAVREYFTDILPKNKLGERTKYAVSLIADEIKTLSLAQQANHLLDSFLQNGSLLPFFIRFIVHVLKETEDLCASELQTKAPWDAAKEELSLFLTLKKRPTVTNTAQEFRRAFLFEPHQTERLEIQGKKIPAFQKDPQRLSDMLCNQTLETQFKPTPWRFRHFILPLVIGVSIIAWLLLQK